MATFTSRKRTIAALCVTIVCLLEDERQGMDKGKGKKKTHMKLFLEN